jgi:hypothetical protein
VAADSAPHGGDVADDETVRDEIRRPDEALAHDRPSRFGWRPPACDLGLDDGRFGFEPGQSDTFDHQIQVEQGEGGEVEQQRRTIEPSIEMPSGRTVMP